MIRNKLKKTGCGFLIAGLMLTAPIPFRGFAAGINDAPAAAGEKNAAVPDAFEKIDENSRFILYFQPSTAEIAVENRRNHQVWYSNPQDRSADGLAGGQKKNELASQVLGYYYQDSRNSMLRMDSYSSSVLLNQFEATREDGALRVKYTLGQEAFTNDLLPAVISRERMESRVLPPLSEEEAAQIKNRYELYVLSEIDESTRDIILNSFPILKKHSIYVRKMFPAYVGEQIYKLFRKAGYTTADLQKDCEENGVENTYKTPVILRMELLYRLTDRGLNVEFDPSKIRCPKEHPLLRVELLPYFGAGGMQEEGYLFVPDGSGAVINFNNGKLKAQGYSEKLFGRDRAMTSWAQGDAKAPSVLPVYGISKGNGAFLATIDEGYEVAGIFADIAGKTASYNYAGNYFDVMPSDIISMSGTGNPDDMVAVHAGKMLRQKISLTYHLFDEPAQYGDLAVYYRNLLLEKGVLKESDQRTPELNIEFTASAAVNKSFFGFHYQSQQALTTYRQAAEILEGLGGLRPAVKYSYALNGGKRQGVLDSVKLEKSAGGKKELQALEKTSAALSFAARFRSAAKAPKAILARSLSKDVVKLFCYDFIGRYVLSKKDYEHLISPGYLEKQGQKLTKSLTKNKVNLLLTDVHELDGDYHANRFYDRVRSREETEKFLKALSGKTALSADYGSYYAFPYLSSIWNIPAASSGYQIEDAAVPFYAMVVRGSIPYTAAPVNESPDARKAFLKAVEIGAGLQYSWIFKAAENPVDFTERYPGRVYGHTVSQAKAYAAEMKSLLDQIGSAPMTGHIRHSATLTESRFGSGHAVYVNYGSTAAEVAGLKIEPMHYLCVKTGGEERQVSRDEIAPGTVSRGQ